MEDLKNLMMEFFEKNKGYKTEHNLRTIFGVNSEEKEKIFLSALEELTLSGTIFFDERLGYRIFNNDIYQVGIVKENKNRTLYIETNDRTYYIQNLKDALIGDYVYFSILNKKAVVKRILKRNLKNKLFMVEQDTYVPLNKQEKIEIVLKIEEKRKLVDGEIINVDFVKEICPGVFMADLNEVVCHKDDPDSIIKILAIKYGIETEFPNDINEELENVPVEVKKEDKENRVDLTKLPIVTIDCDTTKDRDDAVFVEKLADGNYHLIVSISAVSHYIKKNSKIYKEALKRGNSFYPLNTCIPMFPRKISNGICSLNPNVDRLTKTCDMILDKEGNMVKYEIYDSVIKSKKAMKYSEVNQILDGAILTDYVPYIEQIRLMGELSDILEKKKEERNYLDFHLGDVDIIQDENKNVIGFKSTGSGKAEKLIENFMVLTNETIASNYSWLPFIYRVHESPDVLKISETLEYLKEQGYNIPKINHINEYTIKKVLDYLGQDECGMIASELLLRSMKKARYDVVNQGHFALQLENYCHFTSPIRRIADFEVHTLIDNIETMDYSKKGIKNLEKDLEEKCIIASKMEKVANNMEIEARRIAMKNYMLSHIDDVFDAYVLDILDRGIVIRTTNFVEGFINLDNPYKYSIGDTVSVICKNCDKSNSRISFELYKNKTKKINQ